MSTDRAFERGLDPRKLGGKFGRGAKPPAEAINQRFQRKPVVLPVILEV